MNIYEKLNRIQTELKAKKGQKNTFGNYKYRSLEDINEAVKPFLKELKLVLVLQDSVEIVGERIYVKAKAMLIDVDKPTERFQTTAFARESLTKKGMDESQITGSSSSYARKYCLNALFCIDDTKDADKMDNRVKQPKNTAKNDFLTKMKGFAEHEPDAYWKVMGKWQMKKASQIKNPEAQEGILQEIDDEMKL